MAECIERDAASADSDRNKIKTPFARIVVEGTPGKPCYNIWYFDPANGECHIGFGSYCLDNVFNWLAEEFEITEPYADIAPVVRCKDCIYTRKLYGRLVCKYETCSGCILREDFFCANGTRKETRKDGGSDALD